MDLSGGTDDFRLDVEPGRCAADGPAALPGAVAVAKCNPGLRGAGTGGTRPVTHGTYPTFGGLPAQHSSRDAYGSHQSCPATRAVRATVAAAHRGSTRPPGQGPEPEAHRSSARTARPSPAWRRPTPHPAACEETPTRAQVTGIRAPCSGTPHVNKMREETFHRLDHLALRVEPGEQGLCRASINCRTGLPCGCRDVRSHVRRGGAGGGGLSHIRTGIPSAGAVAIRRGHVGASRYLSENAISDPTHEANYRAGPQLSLPVSIEDPAIRGRAVAGWSL